MNASQYLLPAIMLTAVLSGSTQAQTVAAGNDAAPSVTGHHPERGPDGSWASGHHPHEEGYPLLSKLNLTDDQKAQIKAIHAQEHPQMQSLFASSQSTRMQLTITPPTDPSYPSLVATAKANAAALVQLRSDTWSQVYAVLTPAQQAQIPAIVAAAKNARAARHAAMDSTH